MARYIDGDKLLEYYEERHKNLCKKNGETDAYCQGYEDAMYVAEHIDFADDVVPKSELEQLQRKYDLAVAEREANVKGFTEELEKANAEIERLKYNLKAVLDEIPETKREVAREIFEDFTKHRVCTNEEDFRVLAELKKKYTEGEQCPDCKHFVGCEEAVWSGRCEDFDSVRKEDEIYEKGYNDALKDVEEMILERKNENTSKGQREKILYLCKAQGVWRLDRMESNKRY